MYLEGLISTMWDVNNTSILVLPARLPIRYPIKHNLIKTSMPTKINANIKKTRMRKPLRNRTVRMPLGARNFLVTGNNTRQPIMSSDIDTPIATRSEQDFQKPKEIKECLPKWNSDFETDHETKPKSSFRPTVNRPLVDFSGLYDCDSSAEDIEPTSVLDEPEVETYMQGQGRAKRKRTQKKTDVISARTGDRRVGLTFYRESEKVNSIKVEASHIIQEHLN
jgi:hypothetical protein